MKHEIICDKNRNVIKNTRPCNWERDAIGKQFAIVSFFGAFIAVYDFALCLSFVRFGSFQRSEELKGRADRLFAERNRLPMNSWIGRQQSITGEKRPRCSAEKQTSLSGDEGELIA